MVNNHTAVPTQGSKRLVLLPNVVHNELPGIDVLLRQDRTPYGNSIDWWKLAKIHSNILTTTYDLPVA